MQQIITKYEYCLEVLEDLINKPQTAATTIIICATKVDFLDQLIQQTYTHPTSDHPLLSPTLHLIATSSTINLVFCPTVPTLRAYLCTYTPPTLSFNASTNTAPHLIILDLLSLHHSTSEFTFQGLSRSLSTAVSTANRTSSDLSLIECKDITDPTNPSRGSRLWDAQVPLLSASVKLGQDGNRWGGRATPIRRIAARWFTFADAEGEGKSVSVRREVADSDEEMII